MIFFSFISANLAAKIAKTVADIMGGTAMLVIIQIFLIVLSNMRKMRITEMKAELM